MGPKKGAGKAADGEAEDMSCELLYKNYRKNCQSLSCEVNKQLRQMYDEGWLENGEPIKKVRNDTTYLFSFIFGTKLAGKVYELCLSPLFKLSTNTANQSESGEGNAKMKA